MKTENQVCTLQQAKQLKDMGITKIHTDNEDESGFYYVNDDSLQFFSRGDGFPSTKYIPAFTVSELGVMLPHEIRHAIGAPDLFTVIPPNEGTEYNWCAAYIPLGNSIQDECQHYCDGETEAESRATLLIYLLNNKHITPEEVNQRLLNS